MRARAVLLLTALALVLTARPARAGDPDPPDPWFGRDKALHFSISAGLAGGGYGVTAVIAPSEDQRRWRLPVGAAVALSAGIGKELYDLTGRGDPSWRDLTWDVVGTATGLGVAWLIDHLLRD